MFKHVGERVSIKNMIVEQIEHVILTKKFAPGDKLPSENELCQQFGASRTSVREALQTLAANGLIIIEKGRGIYVNEITSESVSAPLSKYLKMRLDKYNMIDVVKARQIIEPSIAYQAALHHTKDDILILEHDIAALESHNAGYKELANLDMEFHYHLSLATQNKVIPLILRPVQELMPEVKSTVYANVEQAKESAIIWHSKILESIVSREPQLAHARMTEHLRIAEEHAIQTLEKLNSSNKIKEINHV